MADWLKAKLTEKVQWSDELYSLRFEAPLPEFKAGQFVRVGLDIDGERVGRPYSLVNAPHESIHEIYFNIVPEGPLSPRLAELEKGDEFLVNSAVNGMMTLDQLPEHRHLWLLATGTALGPFLSILKTDEPWSRFERLVLCHSVRTPEDLAYQDTIMQLLEQHGDQLDFVPVVTRTKHKGALNVRIPAALESGELEKRLGLELKADDAHVMLCGNSDMIQDTQQLLEGRGLKRHRKRDPGHITTEKYH